MATSMATSMATRAFMVVTSMAAMVTMDSMPTPTPQIWNYDAKLAGSDSVLAKVIAWWCMVYGV